MKITPSGWQHLSTLKQANPNSRIGFVAMYFDSTLDAVRDHALLPAISDSGFEPKIMSSHEHVNRIDDEIVTLLRQARFVVADFTGGRGGVYFEAGFALGLGLPVIWTCRRDALTNNDLHFDVSHFNFLVWDDGRFDELRRALANRIGHVVGRA